MPQERMQNLITEMHEMFGDDQPSEQQKRLMDELQRHVHPKGSKDQADLVPLETLELLVEEVAVEHPRTAAVMREILNTLRNIGV